MLSQTTFSHHEKLTVGEAVTHHRLILEKIGAKNIFRKMKDYILFRVSG